MPCIFIKFLKIFSWVCLQGVGFYKIHLRIEVLKPTSWYVENITMDCYSFEMFTTFEANFLLYLQSCITTQNDLNICEKGLVWVEWLCTCTLLCAMEHNFKNNSLIETHKFDRDKHIALKTLKDLLISCQGVVSLNMH